MKRIFITGASGCIGHYLAETLIQNSDHELFLLVRNPQKLRFDCQSRSGIHLLEGSLSDLEPFQNILSTVDVLIHVATCWGGEEESYEINVVKSLELMGRVDRDRIEQIIYFSTASILDRHNQPLKEAGEIGTTYIRTKYQCYSRLGELGLGDRITTVFPTLVFGGDKNKPYSHLSGGIAEVVNWIGLIRWLKADGSFHLVHAQDIAGVVAHLVDRPPLSGESRILPLGIPAMSVNAAIREVCQYLGKRIYLQIPLSLGLANFLIKVFRLRMADWDRFCIDYRHFTYQNPVTPASFGGVNYCSTVADILQASGISPAKPKS
jgi:nucleoside-diphosphate-sugar epimerase